MPHYFIWDFTVCKSTHFGVSGLQMVNVPLKELKPDLHLIGGQIVSKR